MIIHENTLLSEDLFDKHFICDLNSCKGACCVEGDFGAPVNESEIATINDLLPAISPFLSQEGLEIITRNGISEHDTDGDLVTTCLPTGECVFAVKDNGILSCGIENAWKAGRINFQKPISCHLYPIRINKVGDYDALNYHKWEICKPACSFGEKHQTPIYKFLKAPLVRAYGEGWYNELDAIAEALKED
jgi:hypothetical protein